MSSLALAQTGTASDSSKAFPFRQIRLNIDISQPIINVSTSTRTNYEAAIDYSLSKDVYLNIEGGAGSSVTDYADLKYRSDNVFFRAGADKALLTRNGANDWDMVFVGIRYGVAFINRGEATFTTNDNFWGTTSGIVAGQQATAHWAEITGGMKVELLPRFFAGWTIRGRFLLNSGSFRELPPAYIAGYGRGEKNTVFDFNLYLSYALRWHRHAATK